MSGVSLNNDRYIGLMLAALGAILFSTKAVLVKLAYAYPLTPEVLLSLRMLFAMPFYLGVVAYLSRNGARPTARDLLKIAAFGLVGYYAASLLDFAGLARISVDLERLVLYTYPLIVILLSALAFGRPNTRQDLLAFGVAYLGIALGSKLNQALDRSGLAVIQTSKQRGESWRVSFGLTNGSGRRSIRSCQKINPVRAETMIVGSSAALSMC